MEQEFKGRLSYTQTHMLTHTCIAALPAPPPPRLLEAEELG